MRKDQELYLKNRKRGKHVRVSDKARQNMRDAQQLKKEQNREAEELQLKKEKRQEENVSMPDILKSLADHLGLP